MSSKRVLVIVEEAVNVRNLIKLAAISGDHVNVISLQTFDDKALRGIDNKYYDKSEVFKHGVITHNRILCRYCDNIIESYFTNHSVRCECGRCYIDGGRTRLIRDCNARYKELAEFKAPALDKRIYRNLVEYYKNV